MATILKIVNIVGGMDTPGEDEIICFQFIWICNLGILRKSDLRHLFFVQSVWMYQAENQSSESQFKSVKAAFALAKMRNERFSNLNQHDYLKTERLSTPRSRPLPRSLARGFVQR